MRVDRWFLQGRSTGLVLVVLVISALSKYAYAVEYDREDAYSTSQSAIGNQIGQYTFRDTNGNPLKLGDLGDKPLVVNFIYTSCHHVCPTITNNIAKSVDIAAEVLGADAFNVVTIGFDWTVDTPNRMRIYADEQHVNLDNWHFLAGDEFSISGIARDLGFLFFPSPKGFDHLMQTTMVTSAGFVYRHIYGQEFGPQMFVEPLKELVFDTPRDAGIVDHWVDSFLLFCTVYNPNTGRYRFDYSIATTILVGLLCLGAVATFIFREWRRAK